jgi:nitronate monooxygenase
MASFPPIIQGGMGVGVSSWPLARAVAMAGQMGVVSGTGIDTVLARRLQLGDLDGSIRRALQSFPFPEIAKRVFEHYFCPGGKSPRAAYKSKPVPALQPPRALAELTVVANFVEVFLAKEGHSGPVGLNLLEKIQLQTLPSLFGGLLAKVDVVLMGAGIPRSIPHALDRLSRNEVAELAVDVSGALPEDRFTTRFDPGAFGSGLIPDLVRPKFLAIVASATLAQALIRRSEGEVDGFVVEGSSAGGHNAPPRGGVVLDGRGEPIYSLADEPDMAKFRELGRPFWLAGSYGTPEKLPEARSEGARGIQVGTLFALCHESGIAPHLKDEAIRKCLSGEAQVFTDPHASPTGFPFKVMSLDGTLSEFEIYSRRERRCDMGYLRQAYRKADGRVGFRCPAEPVADFVAKGGAFEETQNRKCLCNGLLATIGLGQIHKGVPEPPLVTIGDDVRNLIRFLGPNRTSYSARDVLEYLLTWTA